MFEQMVSGHSTEHEDKMLVHSRAPPQGILLQTFGYYVVSLEERVCGTCELEVFMIDLVLVSCS